MPIMLLKTKKQDSLKNSTLNDFALYLKPTKLVDSDHPDVMAFAKEAIGNETDPVEQAKKLYLAVRDKFPYDYYHIVLGENSMKASSLLKKGRGYCVEKANLL